MEGHGVLDQQRLGKHINTRRRNCIAAIVVPGHAQIRKETQWETHRQRRMLSAPCGSRRVDAPPTADAVHPLRGRTYGKNLNDQANLPDLRRGICPDC